jgi:hypothetical protein
MIHDQGLRAGIDGRLFTSLTDFVSHSATNRLGTPDIPAIRFARETDFRGFTGSFPQSRGGPLRYSDRAKARLTASIRAAL